MKNMPARRGRFLKKIKFIRDVREVPPERRTGGSINLLRELGFPSRLGPRDTIRLMERNIQTWEKEWKNAQQKRKAPPIGFARRVIAGPRANIRLMRKKRLTKK